MSIWFFWLILGVVFLIGEVMSVSLTCLYIGSGAIAAMAAALTGCEWAGSTVTFVTATAVLYLATYHWRDRILQSLHKGARHTATGMDALIGRTGKVIDSSGRLRMRIDGDIWEVCPAESDAAIAAGDHVRVVGYDSIVLKVVPE